MQAFWEIYVSDMSKAKSFYQTVVGLDVTREQDDFIVLQKGGAKIHICPVRDMPEYLKGRHPEGVGGGVEFCFESEDIEASYSRALASGYAIHESLADQPWGKTDFRLVDPDGAYIRMTGPRTRPNQCLKTPA